MSTEKPIEEIVESLSKNADQSKRQSEDVVSQARAELEPEARASRKRVDNLIADAPKFRKFIATVNKVKNMDQRVKEWLGEMAQILQNPQARHDLAVSLMVALSEKDQQDPGSSLATRVGRIKSIFKESDGKLSWLNSLKGQIETRLEALAQAPPAGPVASGVRLGGKPGTTIKVESDFKV